MVEGGRTRAAAERVARQSYGKLVAFLAAPTRDVLEAEDALSEAFAMALRDWPRRGIPDSPEAWLLTVARRKLTDALRRRRGADAAKGHLELLAEELRGAAANPAEIPDRRRALMFVCAHPAVDPSIRAHLILQTILGFDAATIASALLVSASTMGQRLVHAKHKIKQAHIPFRVPERGELRERLAAVLDAIYAAFAEGWSDAAGTETRRANLAEEGIWLGRLLSCLLPDEPEALGLLSLMLHAEARRPARRSPHGECVPLSERDPGNLRWAHDRGSRGPPAAGERHGRGRALPVRGGGTVGPRRTPPHRPNRWAGHRARLRSTLGFDEFAGGGDQSRDRHRRAAARDPRPGKLRGRATEFAGA